MLPNWAPWPTSRAPTRIEDEENDTLLEPTLRADELIRVMAGVERSASIADLRGPSGVYLKVLDAALEEIPERLIHITRTSTLTDASPAGIRQRLYAILFMIATTFASQAGPISMKQLYRDLADHKLVRRIGDNTSLQQPTVDASSSEMISVPSYHGTEVAQLVFVLIGALTLLYTPVPNPECGMIQMKTNRRSFNPARWKTDTWEHMSQHGHSLDEDITFDKLLRRFSPAPEGPIPKPKPPQPQSRELSQVLWQRGDSNILHAEDVSFETLDKLLNIRILWTPSVCEHLEFNTRTKQLKLFKFPSYCVLLCLLEPERTYLDGLFDNFLSSGDEGHGSLNVVSADFFREILLTYRLIFGQSKEARALMDRYCARGRLLGFKSPFYDAHPSALAKDSSADPLLDDLCLKDSHNHPLFADLNMTDLKNFYTLDADFPFFANRIALLNQYVRDQLPQDWKVARRERRNLSKFWTMGRKMILDLPTLLLGVIQVVLAGIQIRLAKRATESALPTISDHVTQRAVKLGQYPDRRAKRH